MGSDVGGEGAPNGVSRFLRHAKGVRHGLQDERRIIQGAEVDEPHA